MELTVDQQTVFASTGGQSLGPARPTIVLIHGAAMDHTIWTLQSRYLAHHGYNVLAVDLPGHGRSGGKPLPSIGAIADWIDRLLTAAGLEQAALAGHSMGSLAVLEAGVRYPDRVWAVGLLGTAMPMPVSKPLLAAAKANEHAALVMVNRWSHGRRAQLGGSLVPGLWLTGLGIRLLERAAPGVLYHDLKACNDYQDGLESAAKVRCPALLILGEQDLMTPPRAARDLLAAFPRASSIVLAGCGHMLSTECPNETLTALVDFFRSVRGNSSTVPGAPPA